MRPLQRLLYVRICVRARDWLCMHACVVSLTPLPLLFRIILQCDDLFLSFCVVLDYLEGFCLLLFCFVFTFLLFNLSFIYVCVGVFFCFETSSLHPVPSLFTKEMLAWWWGSKWNLPPRECVCSCDGWFEGRDTTVLGQMCVCVCPCE